MILRDFSTRYRGEDSSRDHGARLRSGFSVVLHDWVDKYVDGNYFALQSVVPLGEFFVCHLSDFYAKLSLETRR